MPDSLSTLLTQITADPWRAQNSFSPEVGKVHDAVFSLSDKSRIEQILLDWIGRYQPCLFGRVAARTRGITTCILLEDEIVRNDDLWIRNYIQERRLAWTADAFSGKTSSFVIFVVSDKLAQARPDEQMLKFAQQLSSLYLLKETIDPDAICHDEVFLESKANGRMTWKWLAGVNYFSSAGDGRWWNDHRVPAGVSLSINSVGHLVKTGILSRIAGELDPKMGNPQIDSLPKALEWAMRTIESASDANSGKATRLAERTLETPAAPIDLPPSLRTKDHRYYKGYYHTDQTLPSEYFRPDVTRPSSIESIDLDFSYLFKNDVSNPDFALMGEGRRIRALEERDQRAEGVEVEIASCPRLVEALQNAPR
jgi:hypothetical protein